MATELSTSRKVSKCKTKRLKARVDFTALVSLSYLLIVFFMLTSAMRRPQIINLALPDTSEITCGPIINCGENLSLTILLNSDNSIVYYQGNLDMPIINPSYTNYGQNGIRKTLLSLKKSFDQMAKENGNSFNGFSVIIKPGHKSNYKNLVDILDEMAIVGVQSYTIINDFSPEERKLMK